MKRILIILAFTFACLSGFGQYLLVKHNGKIIKFNGGMITNILFDHKLLQINEFDSLVDNIGDFTYIPYVSGFDADQIFDFSVLNDSLYNKNSYVGNTFGLPEYYQPNWSNLLYYDSSNPYHWKLSDFNYRRINNQLVGDTNIYFGSLVYDDAFSYGVTCDFDGIYYKESTKAFGTWEFSFERNANIENNPIYTITDLVNTATGSQGYQFVFRSDGSVRFNRKNFSILFQTATSYIEDSVQYKIRVTRNSIADEYVPGDIGTFACYIKGGSFGNDYVLMDASTAGTNPVLNVDLITSNYIHFNIDKGDYVSRVFVDDTLLNFNDFSVASGVFTNDNLELSDKLIIQNSEDTRSIIFDSINYNRSTKKYTNEYNSVAFMGNSHMIYNSEALPSTVKNNLGRNYKYHNKGISGNTTAQMLARFDQDIIIDSDGNYAVILAGTNDLLSATEQDIKDNLQAMYNKADSVGMTIVACTIFPYNGLTAPNQTKLDNVNSWILNDALNVDYRLDTYTLVEDPGTPDTILPAYDFGDGVHLNTTGYIAVGTYIYNNVIW